MDRKAKMLERVRALLAKAQGTNFPEEAEAFRAKADQLMAEYAIEQWQVDAAQAGVNARPMPEKRDYDMSWYKGEFRQNFWSLFKVLSHHCRCKVVSVRWDNRAWTVPVIGLPSDLDYLDLLFTHLLLDFSNKIQPKPNPDIGYHENLAMLKEAGLSWPEICRLMTNAGLIEYKRTEKEPYRGAGYKVPIHEPWKDERNYGKLAHDYRAWCKREGVPQSYNNHLTYRRGFATGYVTSLRTRLSRMRLEQEDSYDAKHEAGSMAVAIRDIRHSINDLLWELFPDLKPHPPECDCGDCHFMKCKDPKCDRPRCKEARKPVRYQRDNRAVNYAAIEAGQKAGRAVDLAVHQGKRLDERKGLPS